MRYKADHKEATRAKIVDRASREFREHGFEGIGIADLMSKLGLSHGGFYAHFSDKEDLKDQAMLYALDQSLETALEAVQEGGIRQYIELYTSDLHKDHPGHGCLLPALTADEARRSPESKGKFAGKFQQIVDSLAEHMPGSSVAEKQGRVIFMLSTLSGAVALARATGDPDLSAAILRSTRDRLIKLFESD